MKFYVPPSRITLLTNSLEECKLEGGSQKTVYLVVDTHGNVIQNKQYFAKRPYHAALKAFYAAKRNLNSDSSKYIVRIIKPNSKKVYKYLVGYENILNPNNHELKHKITKIAKAIKITQDNGGDFKDLY